MNSGANDIDNKIDVSVIISTIRQYWWLFTISIVGCIFCAGVYLYAKHPVFSISAKVLVSEDDTAGSIGSMMQDLSMPGMTGGNVEDEVLIMGSHSILEQTIKELKLNRIYSSPENLVKTRYYYNDSPIEIYAPDELFDTLSTGLIFKIKANKELNKIAISVKKRFRTIIEQEVNKLPAIISTPYGIFSVDTTRYYTPNEDLSVKTILIGNSIFAEDLAQTITVYKTEKKANGISLYSEDAIIQRGKDILNKMIEIYNRRGQEEKDKTAINTGKFIDERLAFLYTDLSASEAKIEEFKRSKNITNVQAEASYLMGRSNSLENQLISAETEYEILNMTRQYISNPDNKYSTIPNASGTGAANVAIEAYNNLILERVKLMSNAKGNNISLQALTDQIDILRETIITTLDKSYETATVRLNELRSQVKESQEKLSGIPSQEREYLGLLREQTIRNTLYSFLLQKREENQLLLAATTPKGKIIDNAFAYSKPIAPNTILIILIALFFGVLIPSIWLYIKHLLKDTIDTQEELSSMSLLPVLGEICHTDSTKNLVIKRDSTKPIVELFRLLRNNLQFLLPPKSNTGHTIIVTSNSSGEGKSFVTINLAETLALTDKRVILVGLDIRLPKLKEYLNIQSSNGITNFLSGAIESVDDIIINYGNIDIILAGPIPPNPSELLLSNRLDILIDKLKNTYDYVIIDSAPIGLVSDTFTLAKYSDAILYVTRANVTKRNTIKRLNSIINSGQLKNVALILNDVKRKQASGYGYGYGNIKD